MGNYKIQIAAHKSGFGLIGAKSINSYDPADIVDREYVFGCQIGHRCVAATPEGPRIMTPSAARAMGYKFDIFPPRR